VVFIEHHTQICVYVSQRSQIQFDAFIEPSESDNINHKKSNLTLFAKFSV